MPRPTVPPEERAERRRRYMREYQRNRRQSMQVGTSETETEQLNSMSQAEYMREYRRRQQQITEIEVVEIVEPENISNSRAEYMREYRRRRRLTAEIEVVETEEENQNSRAKYMREYRRSRPHRATDENERVVRRRRLNDTETDNWSNIQRKYESTIRKGPTYVCGCCGGLFFQKDISSVKRNTLAGNWGCSEDIVEKTFWAIDNNKIPSTFVDEEITDNIPLCPTCKTSLKKKTLPTLALSSGLHFPDHVVCLDDLTRLEERLVSPRHVFQSIWTHKGLTGQYRSKGGIVNVPVNVDTTVSLLPRNLEDSNTVHLSLARRMRYIKDYIRGNISPAKVWRAAVFLQTMPLYQEYNIALSNNWLEDTASNDTGITEASTVEELDENSEAPVEDENINTSNQETVIVSDHEAIRLSPGDGRTPLSVLTDKDSDFLAFPQIFCGHRLSAPNTLSYSSLSKSIARRFDRRAASRIEYILYMDRKNQLIRMYSNLNTVLRKKKKTSNNMPYTASDFSSNTNIDSLLNKDQAYKTFSGIRSTAEYWANEKKNLLAMVRQFGIPTIFVTLSAAEASWPELLCILKFVTDGIKITEDQAKELSYAEKAILIQKDPITCARYFDYRFRQLKKTWKAPNGPFGDRSIKEYFFRIEFQHRGSPHVHMLVWLEGAPKYEPNSQNNEEISEYNETEICNFIDEVITCKRQWSGIAHDQQEDRCSEDTWNDLLKRQYHRHTSTCQRKRNNVTICRFNIPFYPMDKTRILCPITENEALSENTRSKLKQNISRIKTYLQEHYEDLHTSAISFTDFLIAVSIPSVDEYVLSIRSTLKMNKIMLKRQPNEVMINNYNQKIFSMFRSNMDIQFILDPYACCAYVVDYINKADRGLSKTLEEVYNKHKDDSSSTPFNMMRSLAATYYNASEISAQEAAYNLLRIKMSEASTVTIFIPTSKPENRLHILKKQSELIEMDPDSTNCFEAGLIDHYVCRPEELENLTLAQFAAYFEFSKKRPSSTANSNTTIVANDDNINEDNADHDDEQFNSQENSSHVQLHGSPGQVYSLLQNQGYIRRRTKSRVIRYYKFNIDQDREDYFRCLLMLYTSWRNEDDELLSINCEQKFLDNNETILLAKKEFCQIDDDVLEGYVEAMQLERSNLEDEEENAPEENVNAIAPYFPDDDFGRYTLDVDDNEEGQYHRTTDLTDELNPNGSTHNNRLTYLERVKIPKWLSNSDYQDLISTLNLQQRQYLYHIIDHIRNNNNSAHMHQSSPSIATQAYSPLYHFVTGGAGTGKSLLIKALYQSLVREFDKARERNMNTPSVLLCAPTGKAAFNISAQTLHNAFQLPVTQRGRGGLTQLSSDVSHSMGVALADLKVVIIDEISMVGETLFGWVDRRLRDIFDRSVPFGGKIVIVFGDFLQLPPVGDTPLYSNNISRSSNPFVSLFGYRIWDLFKVHKLTEIMRQRDDVPFAVVLNNMAIGTMTEVDVQILQSRVIDISPEDAMEITNGRITLPASLVTQESNSTENSDQKPVYLFNTNAHVQQTNQHILTSLNTEGAISKSFDRVIGQCMNRSSVDQLLYSANDQAKQSDVQGLIKTLLLKVDGKYMMTVNIDTTDGLVNGATGILKRINYGQSSVPANTESEISNPLNLRKPLRLWIKLDDERSGKQLRRQQERIRQHLGISDNLTMIEPHSMIIRRNIKSHIHLTRTQFPMVPAEAITVHKSQGGTYKSVVVFDHGSHRMSRSLLYVSCSRATSADGLKLICKGNRFIPPKSITEDRNNQLQTEISRHQTVQLETSFGHLRKQAGSNYIQLISHNVQSLRAHINQITSDEMYLKSDILLFNETWTLPSHEICHIPEFTLVSSVDSNPTHARVSGACCYVRSSLLSRTIESSTGTSTYTTDSKLFLDGNNGSASVALFVLNESLYCSIYVSPLCQLSTLMETLDFIAGHNCMHMTIAGDFNVDFTKESSKKTSLLQFMNSKNMTTTLPMTIQSTTNQNTLIDNIFSTMPTLDSGRYISLTSYHAPLWAKFM